MTEDGYRPPETLRRFMLSNAFIRVAVGPVGSGKSSACVMELVSRAMRQAPSPSGVRKSRLAVIRNTYRELTDTTRKTFAQWVPERLGEWREKDFTFWLRAALQDGTTCEAEIMFRALDRPDDVRKLLSLELTGAYINEFREVSKSIFDALKTRIGRFPAAMDGGCTWSGIWGDTNPWHSQHWAVPLFRGTLPDHELFRQPSGRSPRAENVENLPARYYERLLGGQDAEWVKVYVDGEDATVVVGSIWGEALASCPEPSAFEHGRDGVFTAWDLGRSDSTAIWWFRSSGRASLDVIDYYENSMQPLSHYVDVVEKRGYGYVKHWLPHDARARTLASELSVQDQLSARWPGRVDIGPGLSLADGLAAGRWLLEGRCRIHSRCAEGVQALHAYRREYDEETRSYSNTPVHDWASHGNDAWRYMAVVAKHVGLIMAEKPSTVVRPPGPIDRRWTLEELWADRARAMRGGKRV